MHVVATLDPDDPVARYLELGLRLGRHLEGMVDAYYGPDDLRRRVDDEPLRALPDLPHDARPLVAEDLDDVAEHELVVGMTDAARLDVDHHFTGLGIADLDGLDREATLPVRDDRPRIHAATILPSAGPFV